MITRLKIILIFLLGFSLGAFVALTFSYCILDPKFDLEKLYYSLPGALVGLASLTWNIFNQAKISVLSKTNEQRDYALKSFDRYAAEPVQEAIRIIDGLMKEIEEALHAPASGDLSFQLTIKKIVENRVTLCAVRAYRLCAEADAYMEQEGHKSNFEREMYFVSDEEKLDDLIVVNLDHAQHDRQPKVILDAKMRHIEKTITKKKAKIRSILTKTARDIAGSFNS